MRVLFRVAAGPRLGYGHLVRASSLSRALGVPLRVSLRGRAAADRVLKGLHGHAVNADTSNLRRDRTDVLVLDDPCQAHAARWCAQAHRQGILVVSLHDLGIAPVDADLAVDGSLGARRARGRRVLAGARYAVLDPSIPALAHSRAQRVAADDIPPTIVIALGGGPRRKRALEIGRVVSLALPNYVVTVVTGFSAPSVRRKSPNAPANLVERPSGADFLHLLAGCSAAVVGGGLTLYEACGLGVPAIPVQIVAPQASTIRSFAANRLVTLRGVPIRVDERGAAETIADLLMRLIRQAPRRERMVARARLAIDGAGAARVAAAIRDLHGRCEVSM